MALFLICWVGRASNNPENTAQEVSFCDLAKTPSEFSGKRIRIRAIYSYMFAISRFKGPTCCPEREVPIWVDFDEKLEGSSQQLLHKFPKGMGFVLATFVGKLESGGPYGDGGYRFKFTVDRIERLEATAKPSPNREPKWVPRNCEKSDAAPAKQSSSILHEMLHVDGADRPPERHGSGGTYTYDVPE